MDYAVVLALRNLRIVRGHHFVAEALEMRVFTARTKLEVETIIRKLGGIYARDAIDRVKKRLLGSLMGDLSE